MARGISLANKCQLLFGAAIVLIIAATLSAPWVLVGSIADRAQMEASRQVAELWPLLPAETIEIGRPASTEEPSAGLTLGRLPGGKVGEAVDRTDFIGAAARRFLGDEEAEETAETVYVGDARQHRYARVFRGSGGAIEEIIFVTRTSESAAGQVFLNRVYLLTAGIVAGVLATLVFYLITTRLILSPVRQLKETAERVQEGGANVRAQITTGDEFEQLGDAFNRMLETLEANEEDLRRTNASLDLRVSELAERNTALDAAAQLKGEFLANVSHELRTPLNSIIGFAELLEEIARNEQASGAALLDESQYAKRRRYLQNIVMAGRTLLEMINELLDMARIEAGKVDLHVESMNVVEACSGLLGLIRPQADRAGVKLVLETPGVDPKRPRRNPSEGAWEIIETDPQKFQQIIFNFLSNAVKFTLDGGVVTLRVERLAGGGDDEAVRVSVLDTGPGIAPENHERIFEKFTQLDQSHTRSHTGTGLGLAICKELVRMLQGRMQLVSEVGRGSMFSVIVPRRLDPERPFETAPRTSVSLGADE